MGHFTASALHVVVARTVKREVSIDSRAQADFAPMPTPAVHNFRSAHAQEVSLGAIPAFCDHFDEQNNSKIDSKWAK
jgi:hypothetical protein